MKKPHPSAAPIPDPNGNQPYEPAGTPALQDGAPIPAPNGNQPYEPAGTPALQDGAPIPARFRVTARHDGFRRCGRAWPAAGVVVAAGEFTGEQWAMLLAETTLEIVLVEPV